MRVVVVHNRHRADQPSGEDVVVDLEHRLLVEAGHRVTLVETANDEYESYGPLAKVGALARTVWNNRSLHQVASALDAGADVLHIHNTFPLVSPSVLTAARPRGIPVVATHHSYRIACATADLHRDGQRCTECVGRLPLPAVRHACYHDSRAATVPVALSSALHRRHWIERVDLHLCLSDAQRTDLIAHGVPAERAVVRHNAVADPGRTRMGPGRGPLFLGRFSAEKGLGELLAAWRIVAGRSPDLARRAPLRLAGSGPLEPLVRAAAATDIGVVYEGLVDRASADALLATSSVLVAPATWREPFGLVVAEALACGVPVIATAHGSFPELLDPTCALLVRPGDLGALADAIESVLLDDERNVRMGAAGRARYLERFCLEVGLHSLEAAYEDAIKRHRAGPP